MSKESKEEKIIELFFNEPTKQWHFKEIVKTAKISEPSANKWLRKMLKKKIIIRIKPEGKMPYFIANFKHENYKDRKKLYAFEKFYETGLLRKLEKLKNAKAVIVFGSFARSDWSSKSDVDVFILGNPEDFKYGRLWKGIGMHGRTREIQVHNYKSSKDIKNIDPGFMRNILKGYFIKGNIFDIADVKT